MAYQKAQNEMADALHFRNEGGHGIAVQRDYWALRWQRRLRQAERFAGWLIQFLEGIE